jgi:hypothetical protein
MLHSNSTLVATALLTAWTILIGAYPLLVSPVAPLVLFVLLLLLGRLLPTSILACLTLPALLLETLLLEPFVAELWLPGRSVVN